MDINHKILEAVQSKIKEVFQLDIETDQLILNETKKEFEGDYTFVCFPLVRALKRKPDEIAETLGAVLIEDSELFDRYNVIKGFLNLVLKDSYWHKVLSQITTDENAFTFPKKEEKILVEFSSPNTNKPLHLGHIRNILLGWSMSEILKYAGSTVVNTQIINDRGIAVCKSMYAWKHFSKGETPESTGIKGDHFVGRYYVLYNQHLQKEYQSWQDTDEAQSIFDQSKESERSLFFKSYKNEYFNKNSKIGAETKTMLQNWEAGDEETVALWKKMNDWVYDGFDVTYNQMGVGFDDLYYESDTYLLGRDTVNEGLKRNVFFKKDDGSVWIDLEDEGLDHKLVLRSDGTAVYMTQDIGTAMQRYKDHQLDSMVYVVGNEQEYHFQVLFKILEKLGESYAEKLYHLSYGMVDLPSGRMKSREGTVVDADDLMQEVITEAKSNSEERGELSDLSQEERDQIYETIGLGALKYFILKVNAKKGMTYDPTDSLDMQGQTAPYIQNAFVRIQSILRRLGDETLPDSKVYEGINDSERELLRKCLQFKAVVAEAAKTYDPSQIANYSYTLAKLYHRFYHDNRIIKAETEAAKAFRIQVSKLVADLIQKSMNLLGIQMPQYM